MTFWTVLILVTLAFSWASCALIKRTWAAMLVAALAAILLSPYIAIRFVWDITGHHDAQDGLAFLFGPLFSLPLALLASYCCTRLRRRPPLP